MILFGLYSEKRDCLMAVSFEQKMVPTFWSSESPVSLVGYNDRTDLLWVSPNKDVAEKIIKIGPTNLYSSNHLTPEWDAEFYGKLKVVNLCKI